MVGRTSSGLMLRQREAKRRRLRRRIIGVAAVLVMGVLVWIVGWSPLLTAQRVEVEGVNILTSEQVIEVAAVPLGTPLARLDTGEIERRVTSLKPVREVTVVRAWPRTVRVELRERTAAFAVKKGNRFQLIDEEGVGYHVVSTAPEETITSPTTDDSLWPDLAHVVVALSPALRDQSLTVEAASRDSVILRLKGEVRVEWGSAEQSTEKAVVLESLLKAAPDAKVYNVSAPSHPTTR